MSAEVGWIYLLISPAMPDLVKVGATIHDPLKRVRQLSASTSAALPFTLAYSRYVERPFQVEAALHRMLDGYRVNNSREFFNHPLHKIIELVEKYDEVRAEFYDCEGLPFSELFATFDPNGPPTLTPEEQGQCRRLEQKLQRTGMIT